MTMQLPQNLFQPLPDSAEETFQTLLSMPGLHIERIVSYGHCSQEGFWYDQEDNEWVLLLSGAARLEIEGQGIVEMTPGVYINIPAHLRHRVDWTDPSQATIWLAVHYNPSN